MSHGLAPHDVELALRDALITSPMEQDRSPAMAECLAFDAPDLADALAAASDDALDALPYGVIEMDTLATVRRYNRTESLGSGLSPSRVVSRHFFREVAPCTNNPIVAGRFAEDGLDATITYVFALRMRPAPVTLRLLRPRGGSRQYICVRWRP